LILLLAAGVALAKDLPRPGSTLFDIEYPKNAAPVPTYEQQLDAWRKLDLPMRQIAGLPVEAQAAAREQLLQERQIEGYSMQAAKVFRDELFGDWNGVMDRFQTLNSSASVLAQDGNKETRKAYWDRLLAVWRSEPEGLKEVRIGLDAVLEKPLDHPKMDGIDVAPYPIADPQFQSVAKVVTLEKRRWMTDSVILGLDDVYKDYAWQSWLNTSEPMTYWMGCRVWGGFLSSPALAFRSDGIRLRFQKGPSQAWAQSSAPIPVESLPIIGVWGDLSKDWYELQVEELRWLAQQAYSKHHVGKGVIMVVNKVGKERGTPYFHGAWPRVPESLQPLLLLRHPLGRVDLPDWLAFTTHIARRSPSNEGFPALMRKLKGIPCKTFELTPQFYALNSVFDGELRDAEDLARLIDDPETGLATHIARLWVGDETRAKIGDVQAIDVTLYSFTVSP